MIAAQLAGVPAPSAGPRRRDQTSIVLPEWGRHLAAADGEQGARVLALGIDEIFVAIEADERCNRRVRPGRQQAGAPAEGGRGQAERGDRVTEIVLGAPALPADFDGDGDVDVTDFLTLLGSWGPCPGAPGCTGDVNGDGSVDVLDMLLLLASWT